MTLDITLVVLGLFYISHSFFCLPYSQEKAQGLNANYKLTSTVMLWLQTIKADSGTMNLGGSLTRQVSSDHAVSDSSSHIANIGRMVEVRACLLEQCCHH